MSAITIDGSKALQLKPGKHSRLIKALIEEFIQHFAPGGKILYVSGNGKEKRYFDEVGLAELGVKIKKLYKMPNVIIYPD